MDFILIVSICTSTVFCFSLRRLWTYLIHIRQATNKCSKQTNAFCNIPCCRNSASSTNCYNGSKKKWSSKINQELIKVSCAQTDITLRHCCHEFVSIYWFLRMIMCGFFPAHFFTAYAIRVDKCKGDKAKKKYFFTFWKHHSIFLRRSFIIPRYAKNSNQRTFFLPFFSNSVAKPYLSRSLRSCSWSWRYWKERIFIHVFNRMSSSTVAEAFWRGKPESSEL